MPSSNTLPHAATLATDTPAALRKRGKTPTRLNLLKLAKSAGGFDTKIAARDTLRNSGFIATAQAVEELLEAARHIDSERESRVNRVIEQRLGFIPEAASEQHGRPPVPLPRGTPHTRLHAVRVKAITSMAQSLMRHGAAGGNSIRVTFAKDASEVDYVVTVGRNWNTYSGAYKGWAANEDHHAICVPQDWRVRVEGKGLASLGGMMTLDAHPMMSDDDVQLYAATWARQGRGFDVNVDRGYIAVLSDEHFHADSAQAALKGVRRKVKSAGKPVRASKSPYALTVDAFIERYAGRDLSVSVSDAHDSGACDFGIRSWCEFVGLDYDAGEAPLAKVLEGFQARPQEEVRRAVVYSVRRHRAERRAMAA